MKNLRIIGVLILSLPLVASQNDDEKLTAECESLILQCQFYQRYGDNKNIMRLKSEIESLDELPREKILKISTHFKQAAQDFKSYEDLQETVTASESIAQFLDKILSTPNKVEQNELIVKYADQWVIWHDTIRQDTHR